jgi:hypothetical protein
VLIFALAVQRVLLLVTALLSARWTIRTKGALEGILQGALLFYGLILVSAFLSCVAIPALLLFLGADKRTVINSFPEEIGVVPLFFFGWLPALIFSATVRGVYERAKVVRGRK